MRQVTPIAIKYELMLIATAKQARVDGI